MSENMEKNVNEGGYKPSVRNSNIEFFRIITMLLIVAHHYVVNSGLTSSGGPIYSEPLSLKSLGLLLFGAWGKIGINCFVLITGYFMCKSHITAKKFAKLLGEVMFYKLIIGAIFFITGYAPFTLKNIVVAVLPIITVSAGFTSAYLLFFLTIPFLNMLLNSMNEKQHIRLLLLLGFIYVFFGTVPKFSVTMNYVSWFCVLYVLAAYVRMYPKKIFENVKVWGCVAFISVVLSAVSVIICTWIGTKIGNNVNTSYFFVADSNTFLALLTGFSGFMFFKNLNLKPNRFINTVAASAFGVLLIHANSGYMRQWLWQDVLNNVGAYNSPWLPVHAVVSVVTIYVICTCIDYLRIRFVEKAFFKLWDKYFYRLSDKFYLIEENLCKKFKIDG